MPNHLYLMRDQRHLMRDQRRLHSGPASLPGKRFGQVRKLAHELLEITTFVLATISCLVAIVLVA